MFKRMRERTRVALVALLLFVWLASLGLALCADQTWVENWTTDNIQEISHTYVDWYEYEKNETNVVWSNAVSDGLLTLTAQVTGSITSNEHKISRNVTTSKDMHFSFKTAYYGDGQKHLYLVRGLDVANYVYHFSILTATKEFYFKWINTTGVVDEIKLCDGTFLPNVWFRVDVSWTRVPNEYLVLVYDGDNDVIGNETIVNHLYDNTNIESVQIVESIDDGDSFGRWYFDYIKWGTYGGGSGDMNAIISEWMPVIISFAMLGLCMGYIKKIGR